MYSHYSWCPVLPCLQSMVDSLMIHRGAGERALKPARRKALHPALQRPRGFTFFFLSSMYQYRAARRIGNAGAIWECYVISLRWSLGLRSAAPHFDLIQFRCSKCERLLSITCIQYRLYAYRRLCEAVNNTHINNTPK